MNLINIQKNNDLGNFILRITIGLLFLYGGMSKIIGPAFYGPGIEGFSGMVWGSIAIAWIVALAELITGLFLLLGFMIRESSLVLTIIMIFAIIMVHNPIVDLSGQLMQFLIRLTIIGALLALFFAGTDKYALVK